MGRSVQARAMLEMRTLMREQRPSRRWQARAATVCAVLSAVSAALVLTSRARASKAIEAESLLFVRLPSSSLLAQRQRSLMDVPRGQVLDIDFIPEGFDGSWDLMRMDEDAPEIQPAFNGADADGASWRQYVPIAIWPDQDWFDEAGNYLGRSGGPDLRKTTVTRR